MIDSAAAQEWYREEDVGNAIQYVHPSERPFLITKVHFLFFFLLAFWPSNLIIVF